MVRGEGGGGGGRGEEAREEWREKEIENEREFFLFLSPLAVNCNHILCVRGASLICEEYLLSSDKNIGFLSVEILWNLLENGSQIMVCTHTCTVHVHVYCIL